MARPRKNPLTVNNVCEHCNQTFEIKYQKRHQRFCCKKCSNGSLLTKQRIVDSQKKTFIENYGVDHPMKTPQVVENFKSSMKQKYGVEHALQSPGLFGKSKQTKLNRYNDENYNNRDRAKQTCLQRYGVENIRQSEEYKEKYYLTCLQKHGVEHASQSQQYKQSHTNTMFEKFDTDSRFDNFVNLFDKSEYCGVTPKFNRKYLFKCKRCDNESYYDISDGHQLYCPVCDKKYSRFHHEILEFLQQYDDSWECNTRSIIKPLEIDIYSEKLKLGIECDSLIWHSEVFGKKNKVYHLNKNKMAFIKGVYLIHVWDTEWIIKQEIVKSILLNLLNKTPNVVYGRKCRVEPITPKIANDFLVKNHIQGKDRSSIRVGLYQNDELVSVMTFCKSRFDKNIEYEMSRYCNKTFTSVVGGASKLFKHFINEYNPKSIVSYSDRRYFSGEIYSKLGFEFVDNTPPNYYYIIDNYLSVENRIGYQKHKLKEKLPSFDGSLSEWKNMKLNGFDRIWDCGHSKWIYSRK